MAHRGGRKILKPRYRADKTFCDEHTIHVNNLPHDVAKPELIDALSVFGKIKDCFVQRPSRARAANKRPFTFAFVNFMDEEAGLRCRESQMPIDIRGYVLEFNARTVEARSRVASGVQTELPLALREPYPTLTGPLEESLATDSSINPDVEFELNCAPTAKIHEQDFLNDDDEPQGINLLVDCIPHGWSSQQLYDALHKSTAGVVSVLIYMDEDERGMRQGLIQMESAAAVQDCLTLGYVRAGECVLGCRRSEVNSIGLLRRCYYGQLSIYHPLYDKRSEPSALASGSPLEDHFDEEISALPTFTGSYRVPRGDMFASFSPDAGTCTPDSDGFTPHTECTPGMEEEEAVPKYLGTANNFNSYAPTPTLRFMGDTVVHSPMPRHRRSPPTIMVPTHSGLVASSTLVIGNIGAQDKENLVQDLRKYINARALSVDIAKSGDGVRGSYKAFVGYNDPQDAFSSYVSLQRFYHGSHVEVRFA